MVFNFLEKIFCRDIHTLEGFENSDNAVLV